MNEGEIVNKSMRALGGILAVLLVLATGCGGSGDKALSKSEFVKQGNTICEEATEAREELLAEASEAISPNEDQEVAREKLLSKLLPVYEGAAKQIGELGAPAGDEAKVKEIVRSMEEAAERAKANPQTVGVSDVPFRKANEAAESYGLKACTL